MGLSLRPPAAATTEEIMRAVQDAATARAGARPRYRCRVFAASLGRWARGPTFGRDVTFVVVLKVVLLSALKLAFFDHPRASDMSMPPADVAKALLSSPASRVPQGAGHAQ